MTIKESKLGGTFIQAHPWGIKMSKNGGWNINKLLG